MHERAHCHDEAANHQLSTSAAFWSIQIVSAEECSSLTQNLMQICCSTQSCQMWQPHSTHTQTAGRLLPPLTSTVKSWLFMHVHSSPLSLATRVHGCHTNHSRHTNNSWSFSGQTSSCIIKFTIAKIISSCRINASVYRHETSVNPLFRNWGDSDEIAGHSSGIFSILPSLEYRSCETLT